ALGTQGGGEDKMRRVLDAVKKAARPALWSQGVKLARESSVSSFSGSGGEVTMRVRAPGHPIAPTVTLYVDDEEWSCDCRSKVDPCEHVVAAAIACAEREKRGEDLEEEGAAPEEPKAARLVYRLGTKRRLLTLTRVIV